MNIITNPSRLLNNSNYVPNFIIVDKKEPVAPTLVVEPKPFDDIVGQDSVKSSLEFYLKAYARGGIMPHSLFLAAKGLGKTTIASALARAMKRIGDEKAKPFFIVNCATLKNVKQLVNQILLGLVQDKDVTLIFDEASELPKDITMALLTILNPNKGNCTQFSYDDYTVDIDFARQTFVFATSEFHKVFPPLADRLLRIELEDYQPHHIEKMLAKNEPAIDLAAARVMATVCRGNARAAVLLANNAKTLLAGTDKQSFGLPEWNELRHALRILPLGLSNTELIVLRLLAQRKESSLTRLAANTGLSREALQQSVETYLQKMGLMEISTAGRGITGKGLDYLKELDGKTHAV